MKLIKHGLLFVFTFYLSALYVLNVENLHHIKFAADIKIIPEDNYDYRTCSEIILTLDNVILYKKKYGVKGDCENTP